MPYRGIEYSIHTVNTDGKQKDTVSGVLGWPKWERQARPLDYSMVEFGPTLVFDWIVCHETSA